MTQSDYEHFLATIASGAALSDAVELKGKTPVALQIPTAWTAAAITFQASYDGASFEDVYYGGAEYSIGGVPTGSGSFISVEPKAILGATAIKVRSGTTGVPVNQGAARLIRVVTRGW